MKNSPSATKFSKIFCCRCAKMHLHAGKGKDKRLCLTYWHFNPFWDVVGKSDPYCEVSMGAQEHKTKVINNSLNPKWNASMQFTVKDLSMDALCITVFDRDLFSPNGKFTFYLHSFQFVFNTYTDTTNLQQTTFSLCLTLTQKQQICSKQLSVCV